MQKETRHIHTLTHSHTHTETHKDIQRYKSDGERERGDRGGCEKERESVCIKRGERVSTASGQKKIDEAKEKKRVVVNENTRFISGN